MYSIVTLSKNPVNASRCVMAVYQNEPQLDRKRIIVVDDGAKQEAERNCPGITWVEGEKPFIFARNANIGLRHAFADPETDSVILVNDDALLSTRYGFRSLWLTAATHEHYGLIAASCNEVGNGNQLPRGAQHVRREEKTLCFVCVIIRRDVWQTIGPLDEEYTGYGWEDNSYCERVKRAGLRLGIWDGCFVDHSQLKSTFRGDRYPVEGFQQNQEIFQKKYGAS